MARKINTLDDGFDLNALEEPGYHSVANPTNGPASGDFILNVISGNVAGNSKTVQVAWNVDTGAQHIRVFLGDGWDQWYTFFNPDSGDAPSILSLPDEPADNIVPDGQVHLMKKRIGASDSIFTYPGWKDANDYVSYFQESLSSAHVTMCWGGNAGTPLHLGMPIEVGGAGSNFPPTYSLASKLQSTPRNGIGTSFANNASGYVKFGINGGARWLVRGNAANVGGFYTDFTFGLRTIQTANRAFFGVSGYSNGATIQIADAQPGSFMVDCFGIGYDSSDTTFSLIYNDSSGAPTKTDLGANFPISANKMYKLIIGAKPNDTGLCLVLVNLETGIATTGFITTNIPSNTTFLKPHYEVNTGSNGNTQVIWDFVGFYARSGEMFANLV